MNSNIPHKAIVGRLSKACLATILLASQNQGISADQPAKPADTTPKWEACGWGGGGFYYSAAYHPTQKGVIYMGSDVAGAYKTEDNGKNWRIINNGIANYGVFSLAVDRQNPNTVYAATEGGLCKSTDAGEHWTLLPKTGPKDFRLTGEKGKSIRCIAVDPTNGNNVYAANPKGKVYKSTDGGQTWNLAYEKKNESEAPDVLPVQFGKVNGGYFGFFSVSLTRPVDVKPEDITGIGFSFKGDKTQPKQSVMILRMVGGAAYRSKNLSEFYKNDQWQDIVLTAKDFKVDDDFAKNNPGKAQALDPNPELSEVWGVDFACSGNLPAEASMVKFRKFFFAVTRTPDGKTGTAEKPILLTAKDFTGDKTVKSMGNIHIGGPLSGAAYSVAVSPKNPALVAAATNENGLVLSEDGGATWTELSTPKKASSVAFDPADANTLYGTFFSEGILKSSDKGKTWVNISETLGKGLSFKEIAVSAANPQDIFAIGAAISNMWTGVFCASNDGGKTWKKSSGVTVDLNANPTLENVNNGKTGLSAPSNIALNPLNPKEVFLSANWRPSFSEDGGATWTERDKGTDITCFHDIRFSGNRAYVSAMDEGTFVSENGGKNWRQLWPTKAQPDLNGHNWRLAITNVKGVDHIISTFTPWNQGHTPGVIVSQDNGNSYNITRNGLPSYVVRPNTMWGAGAPRALALDPNDPKVAYLGIDGDAETGKTGGGIFKSVDGGATWNQLPNQPASRRMFYGLAVDPTDSKRIYWGSCGDKGGLYRSENGGESWKNVFPRDAWIFNTLVTKEGVVYCGGNNLWRSTDHGSNWEQLTKFSGLGRSIVGIEVDPRDAKTMWISVVSWDLSANGSVFKTTDGGVTWQDITGNLGYNKPLVLRFNPATNELWSGGVTLHKIKQ